MTGGHKKPAGGFGVGGAAGGDNTVASTKGGTGAKTISGGYGTGAEGEAGGAGAGVSGGTDDVVSVAGARGPASVGGGAANNFKIEFNDKNSKFDTSIDPNLGGGKGQLGGASSGSGGTVGVLDPSYLKKTKAEEEAELALKALAMKRPRTIGEGANEPALSTEVLKRMKLGERLKTGGYKGKVTNGEITTMRRQLSTRK